MKVILISNMENLGKAGDVVEVKDGYARNYLFPKKAAVKATAEGVKSAEEQKKNIARQAAKEKLRLQELAGMIGRGSFTIPAAAGEEDKLFGSVTADDIATALSSEHIPVNKKQVDLREPIRKLGVYQVEIKLHPEVSASAKIWVVKK